MKILISVCCVVALVLLPFGFLGPMSRVFDPSSMIFFLVLTASASTWSFQPASILEAVRAGTSTAPISPQQGARYSQILLRMSTISISAGVAGTLVGFVQMLMQMDDPSAIGPAASVGLLCTVYGVMFSELFFRPWSNNCLSSVVAEKLPV
jgi:hypothetical protein